MDVRLTPRELSGTVFAVSSKSALHRILICAALSKGETVISHRGLCDDVKATIRCIEALGRQVYIVERGSITVAAQSGANRAHGGDLCEVALHTTLLDCGESATTMRLLLPVAAALKDSFSMTGQGSLLSRPIKELCGALEVGGVSFSSHNLPLTAKGRIKSGTYKIPGNVSSQYISALLQALPLLDGDSELLIDGPISSAPYVDMTLDIMQKFGITVAADAISGGQQYISCEKIEAEGDWSNAAPWLCFDKVTVKGLSDTTRQGDVAVLRLIKELKKDGDIEIDIDETPDLLPVLAAFAAKRQGTCRFINAARLKLKESDRIKSTADMINAVGGMVQASGGVLTVTGAQSLAGGSINGAGDHRLVMAGAVIAAACDGPVTIVGVQAVNKSYPTFFEDYKALGGVFDVL